MASTCESPTTRENPTTTRRHIRLNPTVYAPRIARQVVIGLGSAAGTPQHLIDDATLVTAEIVASAIRHASSEVGMIIEVGADHVWVRIHNQHTRRRFSGCDTRGGMARRTAIIDRLASSWGRRDSASGRATWALLHTPSAPSGVPCTGPSSRTGPVVRPWFSPGPPGSIGDSGVDRPDPRPHTPSRQV